MTIAAYAGPSPSPAPWAEIVPGHGPVPVDILLELPDDGNIYEVVEGTLVRMPVSGKQATRIALQLGAQLFHVVHAHHLGVVTGADGIYTFPGAETGLIPDVGFYRAERDVLVVDETRPMPFAPDLAVEVASPSQSAPAMAAKARVYLGAGTRLVWVVWPRSAQVDVWHAGVPAGPVATLGRGGTLDGEEVVSGFAYAIADLFADPF